MKKGIHTALVIILILVITAPAVFGWLFKLNYLDLLDAINQDQRVKVELLDYQQGWFVSSAVVRITPLTASGKGWANNKTATAVGLSGNPHFILKEHIIHGPIIYNSLLHTLAFGYASIASELHLAHPVEASLLGDTKDQGLLQVIMLANFDGDWRGEYQLPMMSANVQSIGRLIWYGLSGDFKIIMRGGRVRHVVIAMQVGSIVVLGDTQNVLLRELNIDPITYNYDALHERTGLWSGNTSAYSPSVFIKRPDGTVFVFKGLNINSAFGITSKTFYNTNLALNVKNVNFPGEVIPQFSQLHVLLSASDFNSQHLNDYLQFFAHKTEDNVEHVDVKTVEGLLVHTVIPTSFFDMDASSNTSLGAFSVHAKITWKPNAPSPDTVSDVIANSQTEMDVVASAPLVAKIIDIYGQMVKAHASKQMDNKTSNTSTNTPAQTPQQMLDEMLAGGFLVKERNGYSTTLTIEDGVWKIRGRPVGSSP